MTFGAIRTACWPSQSAPPPRGSKCHNPFRVGADGTREEVLDTYRQYILDRPDLLAQLGEFSPGVDSEDTETMTREPGDTVRVRLLGGFHVSVAGRPVRDGD